MNRVIITPAYGVSDKLIELINGAEKAIVIITDDSSPIFPLDRRETWIERCTLKRDLIIRSTPKFDEDDDLEEIITTIVEDIKSDDEINFYNDVYLFHSPDISEVNKTTEFFTERILIESIELDTLSEIFIKRFGEEYMKYTTPREKKNSLGDEEIFLIPVVNLGLANPQFGLVTKYPSELNELLQIPVPKLADVATLHAHMHYWIKSVFNGEVCGIHPIGTVDGTSAYFVEVKGFDWVDEEALNGKRKYVSLDADAVILSRDEFKFVNAKSHLAYTLYEALVSYLAESR